MRNLASLLRVTLLTAACAALSACQTPPPPAPAPAKVVEVPAYHGPTLAIEQSDRGVQIFLPSTALFDTGKSTLNAAESGPYIERVAQLLKTKTSNNVLLEGHTDSTGTETINQPLSEARATTIRNALVQAGVPAGRLSTMGYASKRPVASNATEEGRKLNRRVEVIIQDEKVENITRGEAPNAFESAWAKLKSLIDQGLVKPVSAAQ